MEDVEFFLKRSEQIFTKKLLLNNLWQDISDNFYPERADFVVKRVLGQEFASNLITSAPVLARRELGDSIATMLRPTNKQWFHVGTSRPDREDNQAKRWLEDKTTVMQRAMYDRVTNFHRATNQADHDFASFGQCAMTCEVNWKNMALLYRTWHLRDMAWAEGIDGRVNEFYRKWRPTAQQLNIDMKGNVSAKVKDSLEKDPYREVDCQHIVMPTELCPTLKHWKEPFISTYIDVESKMIMEQKGIWNSMYILPRWVTVSGSQYGYSPAVVAGLPDARLIQSITLVLLEAGEKSVNPPLIAVQDALRSDVNIYAGGITFADSQYDERLGEVLRPLTQDPHQVPFGLQMRNDIRDSIKEAFFLNKLTLPPITGEVTAYEIGQRVQEYIRQALPLFGPMETEYNGQLCDITFDNLMRVGAFGRYQDIPQSIRGQDIQFHFESPLHDAIDMQKVGQWQQAKGIVSDAVALDPRAPKMLDVMTAMRDVLDGAGTPAKWVLTERDFQAALKAEAAQQQSQAVLQQLGAASNVAESMGRAGESFSNIAAQQQGQQVPA